MIAYPPSYLFPEFASTRPVACLFMQPPCRVLPGRIDTASVIHETSAIIFSVTLTVGKFFTMYAVCF